MPEGLSPEQLARAHTKGLQLSVEPWWRVLADLKCAHCGKVTRHAVIRDHEPEEWANHAEQEDYERGRVASGKLPQPKPQAKRKDDRDLVRAALRLALEIIENGTQQ